MALRYDMEIQGVMSSETMSKVCTLVASQLKTANVRSSSEAPLFSVHCQTFRSSRIFQVRGETVDKFVWDGDKGAMLPLDS